MQRRGREAVFITATTKSDADGNRKGERGERAMLERKAKHKTGLEGTAWIRSITDAIQWILPHLSSAVLHAYMVRPKKGLRPEGLLKWWGRGTMAGYFTGWLHLV